MSLAERIARGAGLEPRASGMGMIVEKLFGGMLETESEAGEHVSVNKAIGLPAVFKAIRIISETAGALPFVTYEDRRDGERERAVDHPSYALLHEEPNLDMTAVEFWTLAMTQLQGWGRLFIGKEFDGRGRVSALHPVEPKSMTVERRIGGQLVFYESRANGRVREWSNGEMIYVRLFTLDGVNGLSPIGVQRETMGFALAMRKHGARFFRDAAIPAGALSVPDEIKDADVRKRMKAEWREAHQGKRDIALLDNGASFKTISVPLEDAQFVELWGASKADVADAFNMPPSLLGAAKTSDSLTYGNRESDMQVFLTFTLHNPLKKMEQALTRDRDIYPRPSGRRTHFCEVLREDLLRPDSKARATFYRLALDPKAGWMRRDEVRRRENLPREDRNPTEVGQ